MTDPSLEHVKRILSELGLKADEFGIDVLTAEQQNVLVPWAAYGIIGNGGFKYFYEGGFPDGRLHPLDAAQAFRTLGFEDVAAAFERSLSVFPEGRMPDSEPALEEAFAAVDWDSLSLRELEETVWRLSWEDLLASIHAYMSRHPAAFPSIPSSQ